jgi:hypothetical protein
VSDSEDDLGVFTQRRESKGEKRKSGRKRKSGERSEVGFSADGIPFWISKEVPKRKRKKKKKKKGNHCIFLFTLLFKCVYSVLNVVVLCGFEICIGFVCLDESSINSEEVINTQAVIDAFLDSDDGIDAFIAESQRAKEKADCLTSAE